jgi:hypothetical protein
MKVSRKVGRRKHSRSSSISRRRLRNKKSRSGYKKRYAKTQKGGKRGRSYKRVRTHKRGRRFHRGGFDCDSLTLVNNQDVTSIFINNGNGTTYYLTTPKINYNKQGSIEEPSEFAMYVNIDVITLSGISITIYFIRYPVNNKSPRFVFQTYNSYDVNKFLDEMLASFTGSSYITESEEGKEEGGELRKYRFSSSKNKEIFQTIVACIKNKIIECIKKKQSSPVDSGSYSPVGSDSGSDSGSSFNYSSYVTTDNDPDYKLPI